MLSTTLIVILVLLLISELPTWPYSGAKGLYTGGGLGLIALIVSVVGAAKKVGGTNKEAAGKVLRDKKMEWKGRAKKTEGKVQNTVGDARDAIRETGKDH